MSFLEPFIFRGEEPLARLELLGNGAPAALLAEHRGHFALHEQDAHGEHLLARDLLGVHKLFFAVDRAGRIDAGNLLIDLLRAGHPVENVFSVPSGHYVRLHPGRREYALVRWGTVGFSARPRGERTARNLEGFATAIRRALERTFRVLAKRLAGRPVYVTLSGGLDSSTIACLAREHFQDVHAVTFALDSDDATCSDLHFSRRVAADLGLPLIEVVPKPSEVLELLDDVLVHGQDWRDFNVHCGLVNAALARELAARHAGGPRPAVLTGDTMNELFADYEPVEHSGHQYYPLPRIGRAHMRRFLVQGLDSGDREVGVFARFGVDALQPYALCAPEYAELLRELEGLRISKSRLVKAVMGARIPEYVHLRPKVRAQVAVHGEPGGTMALLLGRGLDQQHLKQRFARLLGLEPASVALLMRAGFYRFSTVFPAALPESA